ncbi:MAG: adenosine deaminase [Candidatus Cloacimonetes bacterium]|nr:adenosine deaminase [Candidatus Cloacimonadota bacterium]
MVSKEIIKLVPKVELHDHMDGSLRPQTVIDLAREQKLSLPSEDPAVLTDFFIRGCKQKSLKLYLDTFAYTVGVMQTEEALERVACEDIEDLAAQNVVYAEVRFAPILHTEKGLSMEEVVLAVLRGLETGRKRTGTQYGLILCAMRNQDPSISLKVAELAVAFRDRGVVGFDLAGDEIGNPPKKHIEAFQYIRNKNFNITIHAGEAFGLESIWQAIQVCGAHRIGHGTRLIDDMTIEGEKAQKLGALSQFVLDKRIPLEQCISSNVGTGAAKSCATHPFNLFFRNNFRVFLCSDNRLMSNTNLTNEMEIAVDSFNYDIKDLEKITINAMKSSFIHHNDKIRIIYDVIKKRYSDIRSEYSLL